MNKTIINVPNTKIGYISEWKDYDLPRGHVIVDKGVTGCGYTEYCISNNKPTILCSPRKLLLENKSEQHLKDQNVLYLKNENKTFDDVLNFKSRIKTFIINCLDNLNLPPKVLITYDSTHYIVEILKDLGMLDKFYFIVDEFQSIFLDAFFKSEVEFDFVEYLQDCPNVLYLSATPMLDKYLERMNEFKNLPFYKLDWSETGNTEESIIQRKYAPSLGSECIKIINKYLKGKFPSMVSSNNNTLFSTEAVFYFNSISDIIRVINKTGLTSDLVNIICANDKTNQEKLEKIGHNVGKIPLKNETNKMFTFCTKSAYIGADFYSDCASTYIFADPNIKSLALDISLDLPQIVGRQRNRSNPFKNNIVIFYKTIRKTNIETREDFDIVQKERKTSSINILEGFKLLTVDQKKDYIKKLERDSELYLHDFIGISKKTGLPVYNSFIEISQERAWEVSQVDYQDKISVTKVLKENSFKISEYCNELEKEIQNFLDTQFYTTGVFREKMKMYCEFMDSHKGNKEVSDALYYKIKNPDFRKYYNFYGTPGCSSKKYQKENLELGMIDASKESKISEAVHTKFKSGEKYLKKDIKQVLQSIYRDLGITSSKPKATDLGKYFDLERIRIKQQEGYLLKEKL